MRPAFQKGQAVRVEVQLQAATAERNGEGKTTLHTLMTCDHLTVTDPNDGGLMVSVENEYGAVVKVVRNLLEPR